MRPLLAAASLGALDLNERRTVERHLLSCTACRREYDGYADVVDGLGFAAPDIAPPSSLRATVLANLEPQSKIARIPDWRWVSAVAAVLVVLLAGNVAQLTRGQADNTARPATNSQPVVAASTSQMAWYDLLTSSQSASAPQGTLCAQQHGSLAWLMVENLPPLPKGRTYQAWLTFGDQRQGAGTFVVDDRGRGFLTIHLTYPISNYSGFGITEEPSGGSQVPTGIRLLSVSW